VARTWPAQPDEAQEVARLLVAFRDHLGEDRPPADAMLASVRQIMATPDAEYLLGATGDDRPAAVCQLRFRHSVWTSSPDCWLEDLFVEAHARRHGLGAALVQAAFERARARGCRRIELDTNETNAPALALYHRLGFSERSKGGAGRDLFLGHDLQP
jgi:GNAT superfamily N-acetyltransferase